MADIKIAGRIHAGAADNIAGYASEILFDDQASNKTVKEKIEEVASSPQTMIVTISSDGNYTADKTFAEIKAFIDNGGTVIAKDEEDGDSYYYLDNYIASEVVFCRNIWGSNGFTTRSYTIDNTNTVTFDDSVHHISSAVDSSSTTDIANSAAVKALHDSMSEIKSISVNNTEQQVDQEGNVDIAVPDSLADLAGDSTHRTVTDAEKATWNGKQDALTFDNVPTANSNNPVKSGGVYQAIQDIDVSSQISGKADKSEMSVVAGTGANADKTTITLKSGTSATVLTQHQDVSGKEDKSNKVTSFSSPTDTQYPSAKLVNDQLATKQNTISDLSTIRSGASAGATAYQKPGTGIPSTDLASAVQTSLGKADTAIQSVTVGTTTTGAAGTNASVVNGGTATAPVLNFTIPQGAQGVKGDTVIMGGESSYTLYNTTGDAVDGAMTQQAVTRELTELAGEVTNVKDYVMPSAGVDVTYNESSCESGRVLKTNGITTSFSGYMTSDFIAIPEGTEYIYTSGQLHTMNATYCGFKFYTSNTAESVISDNVAPTDGSSVPSTINMSDWPTAKYLRFCIHGTTGSVRFYTASGISPIVGALIVQDLGDSEVKAVSQKRVTDAINAITADGVDVIFDTTNSYVSNGVLRATNSVQSMSGYITSSIISIPTGTQYIETHGLYDYTGTFTGLIFLTDNNTPIVVGEAGSQIPKLIDLKDYPTATKLRWCAKTSSVPTLRCYSYSKIKGTVLTFTSDEIGDSDTTLVSQKGISDALAQMADELNGREYAILQSDPLTSANNNWTYGSGGSWSYTSNGATPTSTGDTYYMRNTIPYYSDRRYMRTNVTMGIDTKLIIVCSFGDSLNEGGGASAFGIDFSAKTLIIYGVPAYNNVSGDGQITSVGYDLTKQLETTTIPDAMIGARKYVVELHKHGTISKLVLMDTLTGNSVYVAHDGWAAGRQNESYGFYCESGTLPTLSNFAVYSLKNPDIVFTGDSITEGVGVADRSLSYPNRFRNSVRAKSVVISARGNLTIDTLMPLFESEWNIVRPKMISVLIGANGGNTASKFAALKSACDAIDAELVVHYCSCRTGRDMSTNNDTLIPALGMESAHFDWATAIDNTPNSSYSNINNALFSDSVHPNEDGHGEMYKRLRIDSICLFI